MLLSESRGINRLSVTSSAELKWILIEGCNGFLTLNNLYYYTNLTPNDAENICLNLMARFLKWPTKRMLMPRPSAWTKYFLSWTKLKLSKIKILSRVKKYIFCFQKSFKTKFPDWKSIFNNKYSFCMTFESKKCSF